MGKPDLATQAAAVAAEIDEAMWLRAREGDVAAAKVVYARLGELVMPAPPALPPSWPELQALILQIQQQQEGLCHGLLDDTAQLDTGKAG